METCDSQSAITVPKISTRYGRSTSRVLIPQSPTAAFSLVAESGEEKSDASVSEIQSLDDQAILGFIVAESSRRGMGHIITIDVRSIARRHHIGSALLDAAESRLRATKCQAVRLETAVDNASAIFFYKRHGYDVIKVIPHYYSNGVDALLLEKNLLSIESSS